MHNLVETVVTAGRLAWLPSSVVCIYRGLSCRCCAFSSSFLPHRSYIFHHDFIDSQLSFQVFIKQGLLNHIIQRQWLLPRLRPIFTRPKVAMLLIVSWRLPSSLGCFGSTV